MIDMKDDWTPADYKPVTEWKGEGAFSPYLDTASCTTNIIKKQKLWIENDSREQT